MPESIQARMAEKETGKDWSKDFQQTLADEFFLSGIRADKQLTSAR